MKWRNVKPKPWEFLWRTSVRGHFQPTPTPSLPGRVAIGGRGLSPVEERPSLRPLPLGFWELWLCPVGMAGSVGGGTGAVVPRSTASQMQRGSGELQSTPTGFWKLQSDPAGEGHGSIAAGIGAQNLLRSASLAAHMGR